MSARDDRSVQIRQVELEAIIDLRHAVLRPNLPRTAALFAGDQGATTAHFAAFIGDRTVACLSLMQADYDGCPALQLRGMATDPSLRGQGLGGRLLERALELTDPPLVWCNARLGAVAFYERHGFRIVGDEFFIVTVGPHRRMVRWRKCATDDS